MGFCFSEAKSLLETIPSVVPLSDFRPSRSFTAAVDGVRNVPDPVPDYI